MPKSYYPPTTLKSAMAISNAIFEKNAGKPIFRVTLAEELGFKSEARTFRELITASAGFKLTSGSYISDKITLEDLGSDIAQGNVDAVYNALFANETFTKFYENFGGGGSKGIPSENVAKDFLKNVCGIPEGQCKGVLENLIQDAKDWLLIQNIAGGDKFVPIELAKGKMGVHFQTTSNSSENGQKEPLATVSQHNVKNNKPSLTVSPNLQLNIQIHIAADTPDEKIEAVFKNMRTYLLNDGE